jgi:hypothetical protein
MTVVRPLLIASLSLLLVSSTLSAQPGVAAGERPALGLRPFLLVAGERFTAQKTIESVFGQPVQPIWGGGLQAAWRNGLFVDVTVSQFRRTGERAFFFEGESFGLGIPLKVKLTPVEVAAGGRFAATPRVFPYAGGGIGWYWYREEDDEADGTTGSEAFTEQHRGYLALAGVEFRLGRSLAIAGDVQYTHVPGIIGAGGVSREAGEDDLGGVAGRFRFIIGR